MAKTKDKKKFFDCSNCIERIGTQCRLRKFDSKYSPLAECAKVSICDFYRRKK